MVIISLFISAIFVSFAMIEQSRMRNLFKNIEIYETSIQLFKNKYFGLPGDIPNAEDFWGSVATNNGNGDEEILYNTATGNNESLRAWQQLSFAGFLEGNYTGQTDGTGQLATPGVNVPVINFQQEIGAFVNSSITWLGEGRNNLLILGTERAGTGTFSNGAFLTIEQASVIDQKIDDGLPGQGKILAADGDWDGTVAVTTDCINGTDIAAFYENNDDVIGCIIAVQLY
ncbi:MAG: hypothetical protein AAF195_03060 [Pseudomonadota bacterium]